MEPKSFKVVVLDFSIPDCGSACEVENLGKVNIH